MRDGRLPHDPSARAAIRVPTVEDPWRVLVSGCIAGLPCGVDGTDYGMGGKAGWFASTPVVRLIPFCPEDVGLGTPRTMPDLHGGDGRAVLAGSAQVLDQHGVDLTAGMVRGAEAMVAHALANRVDFALLTDMSAACGTQVISKGCRFDEPRGYQQGVGVAAAALIAAGVPVVSQRDHRTLAWLRAMVDPGFAIPKDAQDHHETEWVTEYFAGRSTTPERNTLPLPAGLTRLIEEGLWTSSSQGDDPRFSTDLVRTFAPDQSAICLLPPPFMTIAEEIREACCGWLWEPCIGVGMVDPELALMIADFGLGSDTPIILDYRVPGTPTVVRLVNEVPMWVELAPNFDAFAAMLGLPGDSPA